MKKACDEPYIGPDNNSIGGVRLQIFNIVMAVAAVCLSVVVIFEAYGTANAYTDMNDSMETYLVCRQSAEQMRDGSDYLTQQARLFAVTGDLANLQAYFTEAEETCRREKALEQMGVYLAEDEAYRMLETAFARSNELMELEYYSMRLAIEAKGYAVPEQLRQVRLDPRDAALQPQEQMELARSMVFDEVYQERKNGILGEIDDCLETIIGEMRDRQRSNADKLLQLLHRQNLVAALLMAVVLTVVALTAALIVRPLRQCVERIRENDELAEKGAYEIRYLVRIYNQMRARSRLHQDHLSYQAEHDPLTGLLNRGVFEKARAEEEAALNAMLLIDIDHFKEINDTYGHEIGDSVLKRLAETLQENFRADDYVCRVGGDEFAIIMLNVTPDMRGLIAEKVTRINETVQRQSGDVPGFSLSIGIAFGDTVGEGGDLYQNADAALYRVKEAGRAGYAFFEDDSAVSTRIGKE